MSYMDVPAIRAALVAQLKTLSANIFVYDLNPGTPSVVPCMIVMPPARMDYSKTMQRGLDSADFEVLALVGKIGPTGQALLEGLMSGTGDLSVIECLYANRKLDGVISNMRVTGLETGLYTVTRSGGADDLIGVTFTVEVMA